MGPSARLPDLTPADAGRAFVMRRGSTRHLVVPDGSQEPRVSGVAVTLAPVDGARAEGTPSPRRYRVEAVETGRATIRLEESEWRVVVRGERRPVEQTRDDTDQGWGERRSGHSRSWWEEQRPPHW